MFLTSSSPWIHELHLLRLVTSLVRIKKACRQHFFSIVDQLFLTQPLFPDEHPGSADVVNSASIYQQHDSETVIHICVCFSGNSRNVCHPCTSLEGTQPSSHICLCRVHSLPVWARENKQKSTRWWDGKGNERLSITSGIRSAPGVDHTQIDLHCGMMKGSPRVQPLKLMSAKQLLIHT